MNEKNKTRDLSDHYGRDVVVVAKTPSRIYWIAAEAPGLFAAYYRPRHPKTGKPWQGSRRICYARPGAILTWDAYVLIGRDGEPGPVIVGTPPEFDQWVKTSSGLLRGWSTEALAREAIATHLAADQRWTTPSAAAEPARPLPPAAGSSAILGEVAEQAPDKSRTIGELVEQFGPTPAPTPAPSRPEDAFLAALKTAGAVAGGRWAEAEVLHFVAGFLGSAVASRFRPADARVFASEVLEAMHEHVIFLADLAAHGKGDA